MTFFKNLFKVPATPLMTFYFTCDWLPLSRGSLVLTVLDNCIILTFGIVSLNMILGHFGIRDAVRIYFLH